jgi:hypothetical protein
MTQGALQSSKQLGRISWNARSGRRLDSAVHFWVKAHDRHLFPVVFFLDSATDIDWRSLGRAIHDTGQPRVRFSGVPHTDDLVRVRLRGYRISQVSNGGCGSYWHNAERTG